VMNAISRMSARQFGHASGNSSPTLAISLAQAIRDVSWGARRLLGGGGPQARVWRCWVSSQR